MLKQNGCVTFISDRYYEETVKKRHKFIKATSFDGTVEYQNKAEISSLMFSVRDCSFNDKMRLYIRDLPQIVIQAEVCIIVEIKTVVFLQSSF